MGICEPRVRRSPSPPSQALRGRPRARRAATPSQPLYEPFSTARSRHSGPERDALGLVGTRPIARPIAVLAIDGH